MRVRVPRFRSHLHLRTFITFLRVARHNKEAPLLLARFQIVSRNITAHAILRTRVANHHNPTRYLWRTRDRVSNRSIRERIHAPHHRTGSRIQTNQEPIQRAHINFSLPHGHTAVHHIATRPAPVTRINRRKILPQALARFGIERIHRAPRTRSVHDAIGHNGRGFQPARHIADVRAGIILPRETQLLHIALVDIIERRKMLHQLVAAQREPIFCFAIRQPLLVNPPARIFIRTTQRKHKQQQSGKLFHRRKDWC